jgi:hypothetical protein
VHVVKQNQWSYRRSPGSAGATAAALAALQALRGAVVPAAAWEGGGGHTRMLQAQPHFAHTVNALGNHGHRPAAALSVKQHPLQNTAPTAAPGASGAAAGPRTHRQTRLMLAHTMTQPSLALKGHGLGASGQSTEAPSLPATHWHTQLALPQIPSKGGGAE